MTSYSGKQITRITGLSISTLHYYEDIGLLDPVRRAPNGHRRYSEADLRRIDFLKRLRTTGMSIKAMCHYVDLYRAGDATLAERREILEAHREMIQAQIAALHETTAFLDMKITRYREQESQLATEPQN